MTTRRTGSPSAGCPVSFARMSSMCVNHLRTWYGPKLACGMAGSSCWGRCGDRVLSGLGPVRSRIRRVEGDRRQAGEVLAEPPAALFVVRDGLGEEFEAVAVRV